MVGIGNESGRVLDGVAQIGLLTVHALIKPDALNALHRQHLQHTRLSPRCTAGRMLVQEVGATGMLFVIDMATPLQVRTASYQLALSGLRDTSRLVDVASPKKPCT